MINIHDNCYVQLVLHLNILTIPDYMSHSLKLYSKPIIVGYKFLVNSIYCKF